MPLRKPRPLTGKQKAFIKEVVDNPTRSIKAAAQAVYNTKSAHTAEVIASENMRKPEILAELAKYDQTAQSTLVEVMEYSKNFGKTGDKSGAAYASVARATADSLLDRLHGKATQRVEQSTTSVTLNLSLQDLTE